MVLISEFVISEIRITFTSRAFSQAAKILFRKTSNGEPGFPLGNACFERIGTLMGHTLAMPPGSINVFFAERVKLGR